MAQEIVTLCDVCIDDDQRSTGTSVAVSLDGMSRSVDLCEQHRKQLVEPLATLLEQHGSRLTAGTVKPRGPYRTRAAAAADPDDGLTCPACGQRSATRDARQKHAMNTHGQTADELSGIAQLFCPQCGNGYAQMQGLSMHMRATHKVTAAEVRELVAAGRAVKAP